MRKIICILFYFSATLGFAEAKELPEFVQQRLDILRKETERSLENFRTWNSITDGPMTLPRHLSRVFSSRERLLIDSLELILPIGMLYSDEMRDRIVQLMRNELREDEIDTLINRRIDRRKERYMREVFRICRFDTLEIVQSMIDSLFVDLKSRNPEDSLLIRFEHIERIRFQDTVFQLLQLDTTAIFRRVFDSLVEGDKIMWRREFLTNPGRELTPLAEISGHIGDERFVEPLIEALSNPWFRQNRVIEALVRMRVEPYFSEYMKSRIRTVEQIKSEHPGFDINDLVYVLRTQESFLELSKYLLSDFPLRHEQAGDESLVSATMFQGAFMLIRRNIVNADLQEMLEGKTGWSNPELRIPLYEWMQANFGNYEIRRIW